MLVQRTPPQVPIPASEFDALTITVPDDPNAPYRYFGSGSLEDGPSTTVSMDCGSVDVEYEQRAEGTWFYVGRNNNLLTDGNTTGRAVPSRPPGVTGSSMAGAGGRTDAIELVADFARAPD